MIFNSSCLQIVEPYSIRCTFFRSPRYRIAVKLKVRGDGASSTHTLCTTGKTITKATGLCLSCNWPTLKTRKDNFALQLLGGQTAHHPTHQRSDAPSQCPCHSGRAGWGSPLSVWLAAWCVGGQTRVCSRGSACQAALCQGRLARNAQHRVCLWCNWTGRILMSPAATEEKQEEQTIRWLSIKTRICYMV